MNNTIIGLDPGASGGIAYQIGGNKPAVVKMPETEGDILDLLKNIRYGSEGNTIAFMEQVGGFVQGSPAPGSAMFNFGENFGFIKGALMALGIRIELVRPQHWQRALCLGTSGKEKGDSKQVRDRKKREWKNKLKERAQQLYPDVNVTLATADALLLLEYGKQAMRS